MNIKFLMIIYVIIAFIIFTIILKFFLVSNKRKLPESNKTTLDYIKYNYIYSIHEKETYYEIIIKNQPKCDKVPCDPHIVETIKIYDKEGCDMLNYLFDDIFNKDEKEKTVNDENLTEEQLEIILEILEKYANISQLKYEIIKDEDNFNSTYSERGYSYVINSETTIFTISLGKKPNQGYTIDISKIEINGNSAKIYIEEGTPIIGKSYSQVIVYPIIGVKFNKIPENILIKNGKTGDIFPEVEINKSFS